jgi:hypothetical protein
LTAQRGTATIRDEPQIGDDGATTAVDAGSQRAWNGASRRPR